ncbi:hypothetical protein GWI33_017081 [Rhynchophorus ferrugineus]|uniref:Uncharacterized protein n=1 Tax=Rhynchophorus ferrugineus TaxID=354439 RepID=A0A834I2K8_RHYFE|nr:hypothetical protein GWI33_017081 [Rhynchophorus ferrugineus]
MERICSICRNESVILKCSRPSLKERTQQMRSEPRVVETQTSDSTSYPQLLTRPKLRKKKTSIWKCVRLPQNHHSERPQDLQMQITRPWRPSSENVS